MATKEQIENLLQQLMTAPPSVFFQNIDKNAVGIRAILKYLSETEEKVTAGKISDHMKVSTARIAVLLKKMADKDLIIKESDPADGRIVVVRLSEHGRKTAAEIRETAYAHLGAVIDRVGMERMLEFAAISKEIYSVIRNMDFPMEF